MPYKVVERDGQHCVVLENEPDGKVFGCHPNAEDAYKQIAAIETNEKMAEGGLLKHPGHDDQSAHNPHGGGGKGGGGETKRIAVRGNSVESAQYQLMERGRKLSPGISQKVRWSMRESGRAGIDPRLEISSDGNQIAVVNSKSGTVIDVFPTDVAEHEKTEVVAMSRNRNKKHRYRIQTGTPVREVLLEIEGEGEEDFEKIGARNSAADQGRIQSIHNLAAELGADCPPTPPAPAVLEAPVVEASAVPDDLLKHPGYDDQSAHNPHGGGGRATTDTRRLFESKTTTKPGDWGEVKATSYNRLSDQQKEALRSKPVIRMPRNAKPWDKIPGIPTGEAAGTSEIEYILEVNGKTYYANTEGYSYARELLRVDDFQVADAQQFQEAEGLTKSADGASAPAESAEVSLFVPITKVDAQKREVWGTAAQEVGDQQNEIFDYESSKPHFMEWSEAARKRSGGKSLGNLRAMHSPIAAGKLIALDFADQRRSIQIGTKIVDDNEWRKVLEGVYTGFSIGGKYMKRWPDRGTGLTRYTAKPVEVSLVDNPAIPTATFDVVKEDGAVEVRKFAHYAEGASKAQLPSAPKGDAKVVPASPPSETVPLVEMPRPAKAIEIDPASPPNGEQLAAAGAQPAKQVLAPAPADATPPNGIGVDNQAQIAKRVGIAVKESVWGKDEGGGDWRKFGDPVNRRFSCVDAAKAVLSFWNYNQGKGRETYDKLEWAVIGRRIARLSEAVLAVPHRYEPATQKVVRLLPEGAAKMHSKVPELVAQARALLTTAKSGQEIAPEAIDQASALLDVAMDETQGSAPPTTISVEAEAAKTPTVSQPADNTQETEVPKQAMSTPTTSTPAPAEPEVTKNANGGAAVSAEEPVSAPPPKMTILVPQGNEYLASRLPQFMTALEGGSLRAAQKLADGDQQMFDELFTMAQRRLLTEGGFTTENARNGGLGKALAFGEGFDLKKGISSSYAPGIYLQRLVRLMYPVVTPIRRRIGGTGAPVGAQTAQWRSVLGFPSALSFAQALYNVPEADVTTLGSTTGVGQTMTDTALSFAAPFKDISFNDIVSLKAIAAMRGYDDPLQIAIIALLSALLRAEEMKIILDNSAAISAPSAPTCVTSTSGGSLATGTYSVRVTALTGIGWMLSTAAGFAGQAAAGETTAGATTGLSVTGPNGSIAVSFAAVPGAVAYNVYLDNGTNNRYYGTITATRVTLTAMPGSGLTPPSSNNSANANGFEGLVSWSELSTIYSQSIPNRILVESSTPTTRALTLVGANSIAEFDSVLRQLWTTWKIAPSLILCSARSAEYYTKVVSNTPSGPYRIEAQARQGQIVGGMFATGYVNKYAPFMEGLPRVLDIMAHPEMPDGTYLFLSETIPYPQARETRAFMLEWLVPYTYFPLASTTLAYPFAVTVSETLECNHPSAQAAVVGIDVSL